MKSPGVNREWHNRHRMPAGATREQRVVWHAEHAVACGCRPVPASLVADVKALSGRKPSKG